MSGGNTHYANRCAPSSRCVFCGATPGFLRNDWAHALKMLRK
jgi:hypothetical protein